MIWLRFLPYGAIALLAMLAWHFDARAVAEAEGRRQDHAAYVDAQAAAAAIARAAITHQQAVYQAQAQETEHEYEQKVADAHAAADRYVADHRVGGLRTGPAQGASSPAVAASTTGGPGVPPGVPADAVVVSAGDVQACTSAVTYAVQAHNWALSLTAP